ncbi:sensor histidine kinase [Evansella cellulosilytica]|uniref:histidine kinase n=1 Tax=Evansella cellulosilytica (strain ATCC 21833 / DSM 2522 / FERM P-1141 / JCM 9156 / N-4) TaxID=649639 RepID=E6TQW9_EVAC2|nr:HAMP domain-containing sensor histidine kinase [Evansella cellulosilytica]ADU31744.1 integral membrane sensor signal transduction histidine kinase [Evansella cellulosilytica DSM 2522]
MFKKMKKRIFFKLFFTYIFILFSSFTIIGLVLHLLVQNEMYHRYQNTYDYQQEQVTHFFEMAEEENWEDEMFASYLELTMNQRDRTISIVDDNGNIVYNKSVLERHDMNVDTSHLPLTGDTHAERFLYEDQILYVISSPIELPTNTSENYTMVMVFHEFDTELKKVRNIILFTIFVALFLAGIIIYFTSRKITSPLIEMNHSAYQLAKGDFSHRVKIATKDEVGQLGETLNYMAEELGSIDQMRKDFVANVSHDLRSPLTSIRGFLGALIDGTIPKEEHSKYFSIMKNETERLMNLVEDLLHMARLEANQIDIKPNTYNLTEQLRLIIAKMEPSLSKRRVELELHCEEDVFVYADENRMDQVFINLLQNALQFSHEDSKIEVNIEKESDVAKVSITDYGPGINEEDLKYIWERFYKKDKARSKKTGAGIGLSIVKHIIDLHGTTIDVKSDVKEGTTFICTLKLAKNAK